MPVKFLLGAGESVTVQIGGQAVVFTPTNTFDPFGRQAVEVEAPQGAKVFKGRPSADTVSGYESVVREFDE